MTAQTAAPTLAPETPTAPFGRALSQPATYSVLLLWSREAQLAYGVPRVDFAAKDFESAKEAADAAWEWLHGSDVEEVEVVRQHAVWSVPHMGVFEAAAECMEAHPEEVEADREWQAEGADFQARPALSFLWDYLEEALLAGTHDGDRLSRETIAAMEEAVRWAYSEEEAAIEEEVWAALQ